MPVLSCSEIGSGKLESLLARYGLSIKHIAEGDDIPGSFWQPPEAGLVADTLYIRDDTPVHSALHEACHYICMDQDRRKNLNTDAGGGYEEEDGVCYLQILLADFIPELKRQGMMRDMDEWGYTFRLGSSKDWFEKDAEDARSWLLENRIITSMDAPTWHCRES